MQIRGSYLISYPGGEKTQNFKFYHRDYKKLLNFSISLRQAKKGQYILTTRKLFYIDEFDLPFRIVELSRFKLFVKSAMVTIRMRKLVYLKWLIKGLLHKNPTDWQDILAAEYVVSLSENRGRFDETGLSFSDGTRMNRLNHVEKNTASLGKKILLFAHWEPHQKFSEIDRKTLSILKRRGYSCVVISTSMSEEESRTLKDAVVLLRPNVGHDFASWRTGFFEFEKEIREAETLAFSNNSVWFEEQNCLEQMESLPIPVTCITGSEQTFPHAESYWWRVNLRELGFSELKEFWESIQILPGKQDIIGDYEVGFSRFLAKKGVSWAPFLSHREVLERLRERKRDFPALWNRIRSEGLQNPSKEMQLVLRTFPIGIWKKEEKLFQG